MYTLYISQRITVLHHDVRRRTLISESLASVALLFSRHALHVLEAEARLVALGNAVAVLIQQVVRREHLHAVIVPKQHNDVIDNSFEIVVYHNISQYMYYKSISAQILFFWNVDHEYQ